MAGAFPRGRDHTRRHVCASHSPTAPARAHGRRLSCTCTPAVPPAPAAAPRIHRASHGRLQEGKDCNHAAPARHVPVGVEDTNSPPANAPDANRPANAAYWCLQRREKAGDPHGVLSGPRASRAPPPPTHANLAPLGAAPLVARDPISASQRGARAKAPAGPRPGPLCPPRRIASHPQRRRTPARRAGGGPRR